MCSLSCVFSCLGRSSGTHPLAGLGTTEWVVVEIASEFSKGTELAAVDIWELRPGLAALALAAVLGEGGEPSVVCVCVCVCVCVHVHV